MVQVNEQCAATQPLDAFGRGGTCAQNGGIAGLNYRNQSFWNADWIGAHTWNAAATFVSGANSLKVGYQGAYHADNRAQEGGTNDLTYRFNNGIPNQLTQRLEPYRTYSRVRYNALYRAGSVDARPADDDRRAPLRPLVELLPRAVDRRRRASGSCRRSSRGRSRRASSATTTSRRARASPTTSSATARPRSSSTSASTSRPRSTATATTRRCCPSSRIDLTQTRTWTDANGNYTPDCDLLSGAGAGPARHRRRLLRRVGQPELRQGRRRQRQPDLQPRLRREDPQGLGHAAVRLADRRDAAAGDPAARVGRGRLHAPVAEELHRHRQPGRVGRRTSTSSASSRRPIRACRAAAATRSPGSTT